ncbi:hypothetical protein BMT55_06765 [Listeria newyorkensis]|uniref:LXG domain-containing protein n=1 Tax=Listeria newyorkensis TaxID=1497681 RepID=A0ABX4XN89_9LIST|nr:MULTISPECIES: T7SS effector LXG polymorphic toxin [Listeria]KGL39573.1 hypothetical protein EP56_13500 [Listeriaceae bacterium FSL A5-0209]KGL44155.1 hypothetical protein EP58_06825 [Listeria newyorkensis]PNP93122.1 hypothetical protein BMT55_06765 [Listeria newyorkensis]RQW67119.1 hypothetical protein DUK53_07975 [Listeria sp. SHR_NRA_18]SQC57751.1 Bacillus transposase protein [Listeria newyorkensis]
MARIDIAEVHNFVSVFIAESKRVQQELDLRKTAIGSFLSDSDIQGEIGDQAKAYYRDVYYPLIKATKNSLQDAERRLKKYVSDFYSQVDASMNAKLDLARMYELQADMRKYENKIEALKADTNSAANSMASIGKNIGLQLGMETAMGQFRKEEEILEKYEHFEATHRNMLRDVLTDLYQVKQSLAQIESGVAFNASSHMFQPSKIKLGALAPKKAKKTFNFDKYEKTLQGNYWVLTKNGKTDADCAEATIAYNDGLRDGSVKEVKSEQEDIDAAIIKAAIEGRYYFTDEPITRAQSFSIIAGLATSLVAVRARGRVFSKDNLNSVKSDLKIKMNTIPPNVHTTQFNIIKKVESGKVQLVTNKRKGNYGEMKMDVYFESTTYKRISGDRVTGLNDKIVKGIDGVYENSSPPPKYVIAEAKYGTSQLRKTKDGKQMSDSWTNGGKTGVRLEKSVGIDKADDILLEGYNRELVNIAPDGSITVTKLDSKGNAIK